MNSDSPLLQAVGVAKRVTAPSGAPLTILHSISFAIAAGESIAIVGPSGSGKTTLLGILAGLDSPSSGDVRWSGQSIVDLGEDERARMRRGYIGFVFQSFHLIQAMTARENAALALELADADGARDKAGAILERVGLKDRGDHYPNQLSGGEQQRVAIARAFAHEPSILFADEPTGNLDGATGHQISDLLFDLNAESGTTLVLVTHDLSLAQRCDRQLVLADGALVSGESDQ